MVEPDNQLIAPTISPSPDAEPFWEAARRHELQLPFCEACSRYFFYPRTLCPMCGSREIGWRSVSGHGRIYTFCIQFTNPVPGLSGAVPFVTVLVQLDEGPRLMSILIGVEPSPNAISCEMPVQVDFLDLNDGQTLPIFRPADD